MTNPLDRVRPRVTDMHVGSFRPEVMVDDGAEGGIKFGAPVAKAAKRACASCEGSPGEPLAQLRAGQLGVDQRAERPSPTMPLPSILPLEIHWETQDALTLHSLANSDLRMADKG
jgi:hypothetical protein